MTKLIIILMPFIYLHVSYRDNENAQCYLLLRYVKVTGIPSNVPFMHCNCTSADTTQFLEIYHWTLNEDELFSPCGQQMPPHSIPLLPYDHSEGWF